MTDRELTELFRNFSGVRASYIIKKINGKSRGFGFVDFFTQKESEIALEEFNRNKVKILGREIKVKAFMSKDQKETNEKSVQKKKNEEGQKADLK